MRSKRGRNRNRLLRDRERQSEKERGRVREKRKLELAEKIKGHRLLKEGEKEVVGGLGIDCSLQAPVSTSDFQCKSI